MDSSHTYRQLQQARDEQLDLFVGGAGVPCALEAYQTALKRLLPQLTAVLALLLQPKPPTWRERLCAWWASA